MAVAADVAVAGGVAVAGDAGDVEAEEGDAGGVEAGAVAEEVPAVVVAEVAAEAPGVVEEGNEWTRVKAIPLPFWRFHIFIYNICLNSDSIIGGCSSF